MNELFDNYLPSTDHLFHPATGPASIIEAAPNPNDPITKQNGTGDSAGRASSVKAPGGHDAAGQRDGG